MDTCDARDTDGNGSIDYIGGTPSCACPTGWRIPSAMDWSGTWVRNDIILTEPGYMSNTGKSYSRYYSNSSRYWSSVETTLDRYATVAANDMVREVDTKYG